MLLLDKLNLISSRTQSIQLKLNLTLPNNKLLTTSTRLPHHRLLLTPLLNKLCTMKKLHLSKRMLKLTKTQLPRHRDSLIFNNRLNLKRKDRDSSPKRTAPTPKPNKPKQLQPTKLMPNSSFLMHRS